MAAILGLLQASVLSVTNLKSLAQRSMRTIKRVGSSILLPDYPLCYPITAFQAH